MSDAMRRAAELTESSAALRSAVHAALAYPIVLAIAGTASVGVLVGVVMTTALIDAHSPGSRPMAKHPRPATSSPMNAR